MTSFVEAARREKLKELVRRGIAPYAYRFDRTTLARDAVAGYQAARAVSEGFHAYLTKPIDPDRLCAVVSRLASLIRPA